MRYGDIAVLVLSEKELPAGTTLKVLPIVVGLRGPLVATLVSGVYNTVHSGLMKLVGAGGWGSEEHGWDISNRGTTRGFRFTVDC